MLKPPTKALNKLFDLYSKDTSKFLIHTAGISWGLASLANIVGITLNKKIESKEKKFLIPQEFADGITNIGLFYVITQSLTKLAGNLADSGKIVFKNAKIGSENFESAKGGLKVVASLLGAVISSNILTPIIRNKYAAGKQKIALDLEKKGFKIDASQPYFKQNLISPMPMSSFLAFTRNPGMKV